MSLYTDIQPMLLDIQAHVASSKEAVQLKDSPMNLQIGFATESKAWSIKLSSVKRSALSLPEELQELFRTPSGRQELATRLSKGEGVV